MNRQRAPGDSLPPVRRLALDLGVHFNTVAQAYRALAGEGWVEIARRSGASVIEKRFGVGYSFNFGHPLAWALLAVVVAIPLLDRLL